MLYRKISYNHPIWGNCIASFPIINSYTVLVIGKAWFCKYLLGLRFMHDQERSSADGSPLQAHQAQSEATQRYTLTGKNPTDISPQGAENDPKEIQQDSPSRVSSPNSNGEVSKPRLQLSVSDWLNVLQMIALICAGTWTIFTFVRFEARDKQIARQLADISLEKSASEIEQINSKRLLSTQSVSIEEVESKSSNEQQQFRVTYLYSITNRGLKRIEISAVNIRVFFKEDFDVPNSRASEIPSLAELDNLKKWEEILSKAHVIEGKWQSDTKVFTLDGKKIPAQEGGSVISELESGETAHGSLSLIIKAKRYSFIGFRLEAFINSDGTKADRYWQLTQELPLVPGDFSGSPEVQESSEKN